MKIDKKTIRAIIKELKKADAQSVSPIKEVKGWDMGFNYALNWIIKWLGKIVDLS